MFVCLFVSSLLLSSLLLSSLLLSSLLLSCFSDEQGAQDTCLALMSKALEYDPNNVQALQTLASIHISLCENEQAKEYLMRSLDQWWGLLKRQRSAMDVAGDQGGNNSNNRDGNTGDGDDDDDADADDDELVDVASAQEKVDDDFAALPPYEARINAAKMLIELGEHNTALELLDMLIAEDDTIMQVGCVCVCCVYPSVCMCVPLCRAAMSSIATTTPHATCVLLTLNTILTRRLEGVVSARVDAAPEERRGRGKGVPAASEGGVCTIAG